MDTSDLRSAYDAFLAAAIDAGNSDASDERAWTVPMVVAHVSGNDALVLSHLRGAVAGDSRYDNTPVIDDDALRMIVDGPLPVSAFLGAQVGVHLPMHTAQIRSIGAR